MRISQVIRSHQAFKKVARNATKVAKDANTCANVGRHTATVAWALDLLGRTTAVSNALILHSYHCAVESIKTCGKLTDIAQKQLDQLLSAKGSKSFPKRRRNRKSLFACPRWIAKSRLSGLMFCRSAFSRGLRPDIIGASRYLRSIYNNRLCEGSPLQTYDEDGRKDFTILLTISCRFGVRF